MGGEQRRAATPPARGAARQRRRGRRVLRTTSDLELRVALLLQDRVPARSCGRRGPAHVRQYLPAPRDRPRGTDPGGGSPRVVLGPSSPSCRARRRRRRSFRRHEPREGCSHSVCVAHGFQPRPYVARTSKVGRFRQRQNFHLATFVQSRCPETLSENSVPCQ